MAKPSMPKYLEYLGISPRTMGWGALLIYDRAKTNQLLAQEYVENLTSQAYFPPFSSTEDTGHYSKTVMSNFRFGAPVLSFTNSNISSSRARLSMKITHGQYITLNQPLGGTDHSIVSIATIDALNSPSLHMDIDLHATDNGNIVDGEGEVVLDLSEGENHTFALSSSEDRNRVLGLAVKRHFDSWDNQSKRFVLNRIVKGDDGFRPTSFSIRTHSLAKSGVLTVDDDSDEGAVIVGVAMNNEPNGNFPVRDSDLPYLLPEIENHPLSMNILLANRSWFTEIIRHPLDYLDQYTDLKYSVHTNSSGFLDGIDITSWSQTPPRPEASYDFVPRIEWHERTGSSFTPTWHWEIRRMFTKLDPIDLTGLRLRFRNKRITVSWNGEKTIAFSYLKKRLTPPVLDDEYLIYPTFSWTLEKVFEWHIGGEGPTAGMVVYKEISNTQKLELQTDWHGRLWGAYEYFHNWFLNILLTIFRELSASLTAGTPKLNALFLNRLLFKSNMEALPHLLEAPGDLSLLGELAPEKLHFAVHPATSVVSANSTLQFLLESAPPGVTWSVEMLPGENGERGAINASGLYRAPSPDSIPRQGRRVKVIARKDQYVAQALVYLVPSNVSVYPSLQVAQHSHTRYLLVAGSGDGAPLKWGVTPTSLGSVRAVTSQDRLDMNIPADQDVQIYVSPPLPNAFATGWQAAMQLDQVTVTGRSGVPELIDILIPWKNPASWFETERTPEGIKLRMWVNGTEGEIELGPDEVDWYVVKGTGELKDGVYKTGPTHENYAIIVAIDKWDRILNYAYTVLPFSLIDLKTLEMLDTPPAP